MARKLTRELLAFAASYDQTGRYGTQTPFSDQLASDWEGGKWQVDGTHNSLVTIANGSDKIARAQLTILYNHGTGQYQLEQTLAPDEQMALDFDQLIHDRVPDKNGNTLPPGLTEGTYRLIDLNDNPLGSLYEGKEIVDKTYGHASYTCMICINPVLFATPPAGFALPPCLERDAARPRTLERRVVDLLFLPARGQASRAQAAKVQSGPLC